MVRVLLDLYKNSSLDFTSATFYIHITTKSSSQGCVSKTMSMSVSYM